MATLTVCVQAINAWKRACGHLDVDLGTHDVLPVECEDGVLPLDRFVHAIEGIADSAGMNMLGWMVGEQYDFRMLGRVGDAMLSSSTLRCALNRFVDYFSLVQDATEFELSIEEDSAVVAYRILDPDIWPRQQDSLFTLSIIGQLLRRAAGFPWGQVQIMLETGDAAVAAALCRRTGVACHENAEVNAIRFPAALLDLPLMADSMVAPPDHKLLNRSIALKRRTMSVGLRVRTAVYRHLGSPEVDQERIAAELGMSTRTLRRKLAEEDSSFQQIVYGCRMRQAAQQFRFRRNVSIADVALRLGYSEHSAFTRAFSKWSGMPPHAFLKHQLAG
jgi:AraC-like DNA-binding protein